jgi:hypothetical protein
MLYDLLNVYAPTHCVQEDCARRGVAREKALDVGNGGAESIGLL